MNKDMFASEQSTAKSFDNAEAEQKEAETEMLAEAGSSDFFHSRGQREEFLGIIFRRECTHDRKIVSSESQG